MQPDDLVRRVRSHRPHVVHFSGHGTRTGIRLRGEGDGEIEVSGPSLRRFLAGRGVELLVLNACYTADLCAEASQSVAAVVGTTDEIGDDQAQRFAVAFYRGIGEGLSIREAFRDGGAGVDRSALSAPRLRPGQQQRHRQRRGRPAALMTGRFAGCRSFSATLAPMPLPRGELVRRGKNLTYATLALSSLEASVALVAGLAGGSVALVGFAVDSLIELAAGVTALWRLRADFDLVRWPRVERTSLRMIGASFLALAVYVTCEAGRSLVLRQRPAQSFPGIALAVISLVTMPLLARAKRRVAVGMGSGALAADAQQTALCGYLSAILLGGLLLHAALGWWWADPLAALCMVPIITQEGIAGVRGRASCDCC